MSTCAIVAAVSSLGGLFFRAAGARWRSRQASTLQSSHTDPVGAGHAPPVRDACDLLIGWTNDPNVCRERACPFRTPGRMLLLFGSPAEGVVLLFSREKRSRKASDTRPFGQIPLNAHFSGRGRATGRAWYAWGWVLSMVRVHRVRVLIRPEKGRGICPRPLLSPL